MRRVLIWIVCVYALLVMIPGTVIGQTREQGIRLLEEAFDLEQKPRSVEDIRLAQRKYEQALGIFRKIGFDRGIGMTLGNLGVLHAKRGEFKDAERRFKEAAEVHERLGNAPGLFNALNNLGNISQAQGKYRPAVRYYSRAIEITRKIGDKVLEGTALHNRAVVYRKLGRYKDALTEAEKSLALAQKTGDQIGLGDALYNLAMIHYRLGRYEKSIDYGNRSYGIRLKSGDVVGQAQCMSHAGAVNQVLRLFDDAEKYYRQALEIFKKFGRLKEQGNILNDLGVSYENRGRYAEAIGYYDRSLSIKRKIGDAPGEANTLSNLGEVYGKWGRYNKALEYYRKSLQLSRRLDQLPIQATNLNNLGVLYAELGLHPQAIASYEKASRIQQRTGAIHDQARTLLNMGLIHLHQAEYNTARELFKRGFDIYRKTGIPDDWPKNLIGRSYLEERDIEKAAPLIEEAAYRPDMGRLYLAQSNYDKARKTYTALLKNAEKNRNVNSLFIAHTGLGLVHERTGDLSAAVQSFKLAVALAERLRASLTQGQRGTFFDVRIGGFLRTTPYEGLARALMKLDKQLEAFRQSEYSKARAFAEGISVRKGLARRDAPKEIVEADEKIDNQRAALYGLLQKAYEKGDKVAARSLETQVKEIEERRDEHIRKLRQDHPLYAATKYPEPMDLSQSALKDDEWALAFDVTDSGVLIYLTQGKVMKHALFRPIPRKRLNGLARMYREPLMITPEDDAIGKLKSFDVKSAYELADLLLSPVLSHLPKGVRLIVVPDDSIGAIPFESLILNEGAKVRADKNFPTVTSARFFGDRNPISYYQSITALTLARTYGKKPAVEKKLLVMADPVFSSDDKRAQGAGKIMTMAPQLLSADATEAVESGEYMLGFGPLPLTGRLAANLCSLYEGDCTEKTGLQATKQRFLNELGPRLDQYDKIVFATHGYFGNDLPGIMEPVLVLTLVPKGRDGFLRMSEVTGLNLNADMVALTACQSGMGRRLSGEGLMGMGRAFQYAGARSVLAGLWNVDLQASARMVESFFRRLKKGESKLEALGSAREEIRKDGYDHPFFWAPFILVGEVD